MTKLSDQWQTPDDLFQALDKGGEYQGSQFEGFNFDIDLCATAENSKCEIWYSDYLNDIITNYKSSEQMSIHDINLLGVEITTAFMNSPYSNPKPFIEKAWEDSKHCKIVCLVKCDPSTKWWSTFWSYDFELNKPGPKPGCQVLFFPKRIKFDPPQELIDDGTVWKEGSSWVQRCDNGCTFVKDKGECLKLTTWDPVPTFSNCMACNGKGYKKLSGPSFSSALVIMDRRRI